MPQTLIKNGDMIVSVSHDRDGLNYQLGNHNDAVSGSGMGEIASGRTRALGINAAIANSSPIKYDISQVIRVCLGRRMKI